MPPPQHKCGVQPRCCIVALSIAVLLFVLAATITLLCYETPLSYLYCLAREKSWLEAKTEAELDHRMLMFYSKRAIAPLKSIWGSNYKLKPGERMVQYLVFSKEPLDVVFDSRSRVITAFTSYE